MSHLSKPKITYYNDNEKASLPLVFWRSAVYESKFLMHHGWDYLLLLWLPLLSIFSVWWIFSKPYIVDLPIGVIDKSHSNYSRTLTQYLDASPDLKVSKFYNNPVDAHEAVLDQQIYGVVIIPQNFADNINQSTPSPIILKVNAQYGSHSGIVQRGVQTVAGTFSAGVEIKRNIKKGEYSEQAKVSYSPIGIERISLFNAGTDYQQFLASTVIPSLLHILAMIIGATTIGRELREKTLALWYRNITNPTMPYPDFKTLKHLPPDQRLSYQQSYLDKHWRNPQPNYSSLFKNLAELEYSHINKNKIKISVNAAPTKPPFISLNPVVNNSTHKPRMPKKVSIMALIIGLNGKFIWTVLFYSLWGGVMITLSTSLHPAGFTSQIIVFLAYVALVMMSLWLGAIFSLTSYSLRMGLSTTGFISAPSFAFAGVTFPLLSMSEGAQRWANALPLTHYLKIHITQLQMLAPITIALPILLGLIITVWVCLFLTALLCIRAFKHPERWGAR